MREKIVAWVIFLACLLVLSLGTTSYSALANGALIGVRLTLVVVLSVLTVRESWRSGHANDGLWQERSTDAEYRFLKQFRRWYHGEAKNPR